MSVHDHAQGALNESRRDYVIGFFLSVVLTAVPFWLVMGDVTDSKQVAAFLIMASCGRADDRACGVLPARARQIRAAAGRWCR